jgi:hypothetical protein
MARTRQGTSVVDQGIFVFGRSVRYTVEVNGAAFIGRLARAPAEAVGDGRHSGWPKRPGTREMV